MDSDVHHSLSAWSHMGMVIEEQLQPSFALCYLLALCLRVDLHYFASERLVCVGVLYQPLWLVCVDLYPSCG